MEAPTQTTKEQTPSLTRSTHELTADQIFAIDDLPTETVIVPEWNDAEIRLRTMTGGERDDFEATVMRQRTKGSVDIRGLKVRLIIASAIKHDGTPLFKATDTVQLHKKSALALERLFKAIQRLSGLTNEDVDELAGN